MRRRIATVFLAIVVGVAAVVTFTGAAGSDPPDSSPGFRPPDWLLQAWEANKEELIAQDEIPAPDFEGSPPPQFDSWEEYTEFLTDVYNNGGATGRADVIFLDTVTEGCLVEVVSSDNVHPEIVRVETECEAGPPVPQLPR